MHDKKWLFIIFAAFFILPLLKFSGGWLLFLLPFAFFWFFAGSRRGWHHHPMGCGHGWHDDHAPRSPRKEKPKRDHNTIETADGEYLEVIDEPRRA